MIGERGWGIYRLTGHGCLQLKMNWWWTRAEVTIAVKELFYHPCSADKSKTLSWLYRPPATNQRQSAAKEIFNACSVSFIIPHKMRCDARPIIYFHTRSFVHLPLLAVLISLQWMAVADALVVISPMIYLRGTGLPRDYILMYFLNLCQFWYKS